jgi:uncharacterized glyoxalase superfamily protein PhnB
MYKSLTPNIVVNDVNKTINFYSQILKFEVLMGINEMGESVTENYSQHELIWAFIEKDNINIMFQLRESILVDIPDIQMFNTNYNVLFITTDSVESIYNEIKDKVEVVKNIYETFYDTKEFIIKDINNTFILFSEQ